MTGEAFWLNIESGEILHWFWTSSKLTIERYAGYEYSHPPWTYTLKGGREQWERFRKSKDWKLMKSHEVPSRSVECAS